jgi:hypothetical protein
MSMVFVSLFIDYFNYVNVGTFVLFSYSVSLRGDSSNQSWIFLILVQYGKFDSRYSSGDSFLATSNAVLAILVGPLLLFYCVAVVLKSPWRQITGIISNSLDVYTFLLYIFISAHDHFQGISFNNSPALFASVFILFNLFKCYTQISITLLEIISVYRIIVQKMRKEKSEKIWMYSLSAETEFLNRVESNTSESMNDSSLNTTTLTWARYLNSHPHHL